jgi:hypothetical protein
VQSLANTTFGVFEDLLNEVDQKAVTSIVRMAAADSFVAAEQPKSVPLCAYAGEVLRERLRHLEPTGPDRSDRDRQLAALEARLVVHRRTVGICLS